MRGLSCSDYTWPTLSHAAALDLVRALDFDAVDIGFMAGRSHVRPEAIADAPAAAGGRLRDELDGRDLRVADVFAIPAADFASRAPNNPDQAAREAALGFFELAVAFAAAVGAPGVTTLPGVLFPGDSFEAALHRAAEGLSRRVELAAGAGLALSVEPHVESLIDTPEKTRALLDRVPGLRITLDHAHFACGGAAQPDIDALLGDARHLQCRAGAPGVLQARVAESAIDFAAAVGRLLELGYDGYLGVEYTWQDWQDCNRVDTVGETGLLRDLLRRAVRQHSGALAGTRA